MTLSFVLGAKWIQRGLQFFGEATGRHGCSLLMIDSKEGSFNLVVQSKNHQNKVTLSLESTLQLRAFIHCFDLGEGEHVFTPNARGTFVPHSEALKTAQQFKNSAAIGAYYANRVAKMIDANLKPNDWRYMQPTELIQKHASAELIQSRADLSNTSVKTMKKNYNLITTDGGFAVEVQTYQCQEQYNAKSNTVALYGIHDGNRACHAARLIRVEDDVNLFALFKPPLDMLFDTQGASLQLSNEFVRLTSTFKPPKATLSLTSQGTQVLTGGSKKRDLLIEACISMNLNDAELVFETSKVKGPVSIEVGEFGYSQSYCALVKATKYEEGAIVAHIGASVTHSSSSTERAYFNFYGSANHQLNSLKSEDIMFPVDIQFIGAGNSPEGAFELRASELAGTL